ncbi:hypothetical protein DAPPUDRAFT_321206 [Daphnia pulex]|uniref:BAG family molecular chaperone regulator 1 n=1 Tax=Daphnia pulex TaxID=6669 RepID=E9GSA1_DAPPU|nr:hypothetical protein DAPPUDRAFT_321206 [Daphnia pulex]|eukprot:EFX77677.1 hypothetical protein DAPPUDRAFT_321206 [Daphnia pulex]
MSNGNVLIVLGKNGSKKFELQVTFQTTVGELCAEIEKETDIPVNCQRIIYNGRALNNHAEDMQKDLHNLGLKSPAKVLVLGKKPDEEDENYKLMKKWEISCDSVTNQVSSIEKDILEMERGFAPKELFDNLPKVEKKINCLAEELMKILISLDALSFKEDQKVARAKRKCIIDKIHSLHKKCDEMVASVKQLQSTKS